MKLYAVLDTKGDGRIVGIWDSRAKANRIVKRYPAYYKLSVMELNIINREILDWADTAEQKQYLQHMIEHEKKGV